MVSKKSDPDVMGSSPAIIFRMVDFPHPLGPTNVKNSPSLITRSSALMIVIGPNRLVTCSK
jgi:hypothetical protein